MTPKRRIILFGGAGLVAVGLALTWPWAQWAVPRRYRVEPEPLWRTDTSAFNPNGSFEPETSVSIGRSALDSGYDFTGFESWGGAARVSLRLPKQWETKEYTCSSALVTPDTLDLRCPNTPLGTIVITGHFTDKRFHVTAAGEPTTPMPIEAGVSVLRDSVVVWSWRGHFWIYIPRED